MHIGVILSAGRAQRMGRPKALLELQGEPILDRLLRVYLAALPQVIVVASGAALEHLAHPSERERLTVLPGDPKAQMIDSLSLALEQAMDAQGAVIQPVDAPFTTKAMIARLLQGAGARPRALAFQGRAGHPALIPRALFEEVRSRPQGGLRALIAPTVELIDWPDPGVLEDLDTPEDYARARAALVGSGRQG